MTIATQVKNTLRINKTYKSSCKNSNIPYENNPIAVQFVPMYIADLNPNLYMNKAEK